MRVKLPESARERKRSFGGATVSTLLHATLIGGTVVATGTTIERESEPVRPENIVYVAPKPKNDPPPPEKAPERPAVEIPTDAPPAPDVQVKPVDLSVIPEGLPPVESRIGTMSVEDFKVAPRDSTPVGTGVIDHGEPLTEAMVEKAVQARAGNPAPRYPSFLASAGVEGAVYAQFVVDTTGRVEPESIRFTKSDHALFEREVRQVLLRSRFTPAEYGRQRVRQLVEQAFAFALKR